MTFHIHTDEFEMQHRERLRWQSDARLLRLYDASVRARFNRHMLTVPMLPECDDDAADIDYGPECEFALERITAANGSVGRTCDELRARGYTATRWPSNWRTDAKHLWRHTGAPPKVPVRLPANRRDILLFGLPPFFASAA